MTFEELGLDSSIVEAVGFMGFEKATPIQEQAIPIILAKKDLLACAQTGTGKTAAFILPTIHNLMNSDRDKIKVLVIVPTRELAIQIDQQIQGFSYFSGVSSIAVYGGGSGQDFSFQKSALIKGTDIIVSTPGKLLSHLNMKYVDFDGLECLILDEADRMLDMGFQEDIVRIIKKIPKERQTLLFSATMPVKIKKLAKSILSNHQEISLAVSKPAEGVLQAAYMVYPENKIGLIKFLLKDKPNYDRIIIFAGTKSKVSDIYRTLKRDNFKIKAVSSDLDQKEREEALRMFKSKETRILVATDVLSRGIDIKDINLVINFDVPKDAEDYVHRVGRTARAASTGVALTLVDERQMYEFKKIEDLIESSIPKLNTPNHIGSSPNWNPKPSFKKRKKRKY